MRFRFCNLSMIEALCPLSLGNFSNLNLKNSNPSQIMKEYLLKISLKVGESHLIEDSLIGLSFGTSLYSFGFYCFLLCGIDLILLFNRL